MECNIVSIEPAFFKVEDGKQVQGATLTLQAHVTYDKMMEILALQKAWGVKLGTGKK